MLSFDTIFAPWSTEEKIAYCRLTRPLQIPPPDNFGIAGQVFLYICVLELPAMRVVKAHIHNVTKKGGLYESSDKQLGHRQG